MLQPQVVLIGYVQRHHLSASRRQPAAKLGVEVERNHMAAVAGFTEERNFEKRAGAKTAATLISFSIRAYPEVGLLEIPANT